MDGYEKHYLNTCVDCGKGAYLERHDENYVKCEKCENLYSHVLVKKKTAYSKAK